MRFDSLEFLFVFLPVAVIGFILLARHGKVWQLAWMSAASFVFYGYWNVAYVPLLAFSVCINFWIGRCIVVSAEKSRSTTSLVTVGVAFNLCLLGYFKYAGFFAESLVPGASRNFNLADIALPLGISFFTFQQITFLVDSRTEKVKSYTFLEYVAFVTFFPQLIAGPIVHFREVLPQFRTRFFGRIIEKRMLRNFAIGMTLIAIGLFKKAVIADSLAKFADPVFSGAAGGAELQFFEAWAATLSFTLQIYFDFSGYCDIAIGIAHLFGIRLPENFMAPYQARDIVDFWRRWHITLSGFLRDYLYIPLGGNRNGAGRRYANLIITMLLGGLWHGAAWTFVAWGAMHGILLMICHLWQRMVDTSGWYGWPTVSYLLTMLGVIFAWVLFRADSFSSALVIWQTMLGANGIALPMEIRDGVVGLLPQIDGGTVPFANYTFWFGFDQWIYLVLIGAACAVLPPSQIIARRHFPVLMKYSRTAIFASQRTARVGVLHAVPIVIMASLCFGLWIPRADGGGKLSLAFAALAGVAAIIMLKLPWYGLHWRPNFLGLIWVVGALWLGVLFVYRGDGDAFIYFQF